PDLRLEFLIVAFDAPAQFGNINKCRKRDVLRQGPHVRADEFDAFRQRLADAPEELLETLDGAVLADPQQSRAALLDLVDERQILVTSGVLDLVDADRLDRSEIAVLQPPLH